MENLKKQVLELELRHARYNEAMFRARKALVDHIARTFFEDVPNIVAIEGRKQTSLSNC